MALVEGLYRTNEIWKPMKLIFYGVHGIGKNSLAATFSNPVLTQTEDGSGALDLMGFPVCTSFDDYIWCLDELINGEHDFKTVIVDTLDWLEPLVIEKVCNISNVVSIGDFDHGKGYLALDDQWRVLLARYDTLRLQRGMNVVMLSHCDVKRVEPPDLPPYDRYQMKLGKRAAAMLQEWADGVFFINNKVTVKEKKSGDGVKYTQGEGKGDRVLYTARRPAYEAKNHWSLPDEIFIGQDKTFKAFHEALTEATGGKYVR